MLDLLVVDEKIREYPNRDYAYSRSDNRCFKSSSSQLFSALFDDNLIQVVVTFHGGMEAIAYEWGSKNHPSPHDRSPDDIAFKTIALMLRDAAATAPGSPVYPVGRMNSLVYPVDGGMEDWMYAAGWDTSTVRACQPALRGSLPDLAFNRRIRGKHARAAVFLVETSDRKAPLAALLGGSRDILNVSSMDNGHIPRNVRLSLTAIDMLQPYVCLLSVVAATGTSSSHVIVMVTVTWVVGGAEMVDASWISVYSNVDNNTKNNQKSHFHVNASLMFSGKTVRQGQFQSSNSCSSHPHDKGKNCFESTIRLRADTADVVEVWNSVAEQWQTLGHVGMYSVVVHAAVDKHWGMPGQGFPEHLPPQSYFVRARSDDSLREQNGRFQRELLGRLTWQSEPFSITFDHRRRTFVLGSDYALQCAWWKTSSPSKPDTTDIAARLEPYLPSLSSLSVGVNTAVVMSTKKTLLPFSLELRFRYHNL